ncbi:sulfotransferase family protein [Nocardioides sp. URHA0020]|uniref:sulfotransferase family protein n=1 Tax=Nocardioides sp. URHA0020 TaxID=1380392 RepID=UPI00048B2143|nr:sulfotransferase [Nocardioides sp. URHA0020]
MNPDDLEAQATAQTGLTDFGDPSYREGLERYCDALDHEAQLNDLGVVALPPSLVAALTNRLKVVDHVARHPAVAEERIEAPVVVVGMFRAGTTFLSQLLDADPGNRALLAWESQDSVPPPEPGERRSGPRVDAAQGGVDMLEMLNPAISAIHHEAASDPTECIAVMGQAFQSISWEAIANVPSYGAWWRAGDNRGAYDYHRLVLQTLQSAGVRGRWTLKSPHHALALDALVDTYPDARLVLLHRDPVTLTGSVCSLINVMSSTFSDADHRPYIAEHWSDTLAESIDRIEDFRARRPEHPILDVHYADLARDPVDTVRGVYDALGLEAGDGAFEAMADHLAAHPRGEFGGHRYDVTEFGLSEGTVRERFQEYVERYGVEAEHLDAPTG